MPPSRTLTSGDQAPVNSGALSEFAALNRRRLFGLPSLSVPELERWQCLRESLDRCLGQTEQGDDAIAGLDRRDHVRLASHFHVDLGREQGGVVVNVSQGGLFIEMEHPLELGSQVEMELSPPDRSATLVLTGNVIRSSIGSELSGPAGMAIVFSKVDSGMRQRIAVLVASLLDSD